MKAQLLLGLSVCVCLIGLLVRLYGWSPFFISSGLPVDGENRASHKKSPIASFLYWIADVLLQPRLFRAGDFRWMTHLLILAGFVGLLVIHGIPPLANLLFGSHSSMSASHLFLRDLFGLMVLAGIVSAVVRRLKLRRFRLVSSKQDWLVLLLLFCLIGSGLMLEGVKMSSYSVYTRMNDMYGMTARKDTQLALEAFWVSEYALVSPRFASSPSSDLVEKGRKINEQSCAICHASNQYNFGGYSIAAVFGHFFAEMGVKRSGAFAYYLHLIFLALFIVALPFSKLVHIIAVPVNLLVRNFNYSPKLQGIAGYALALDACTHCGVCTRTCSAMMFFETSGNSAVLPSEKVQLLKLAAAGKDLPERKKKQLQQGLFLCTSCERCSVVCPSGLDLARLFVQARYFLLEEKRFEPLLLGQFSFPLSFSKEFSGNHMAALKQVEQLFQTKLAKLVGAALPLPVKKRLFALNSSYHSCYSCQRCTNICPVVRRYEQPVLELEMLPHQLIFALATGNVSLAVGAKMIWSCSTCYLCQEHCPNGVEICDIFYGLKNRAINQCTGEGRA